MRQSRPKTAKRRRGQGGPRGTVQPDPSLVRRHAKISGALKEGAALTNAVPVQQVIAVAGCARFRIRWKSSVGGALACRFVRPNNLDTEYDLNQPGDVAIVANVENKLDMATHMGEGIAIVRFTPSAGPGTITYADVMQV